MFWNSQCCKESNTHKGQLSQLMVHTWTLRCLKISWEPFSQSYSTCLRSQALRIGIVPIGVSFLWQVANMNSYWVNTNKYMKISRCELIKLQLRYNELFTDGCRPLDQVMETLMELHCHQERQLQTNPFQPHHSAPWHFSHPNTSKCRATSWHSQNMYQTISKENHDKIGSFDDQICACFRV